MWDYTLGRSGLRAGSGGKSASQLSGCRPLRPADGIESRVQLAEKNPRSTTRPPSSGDYQDPERKRGPDRAFNQLFPNNTGGPCTPTPGGANMERVGRRRRWVVAILVMAALLRGGWLLGHHAEYADSGMIAPQVELAEGLLSGHGFTASQTRIDALDQRQTVAGRALDNRAVTGVPASDWQPQPLSTPGLAVVIAATDLADGHNVLGAQVFGLLVDLLNVGLIYMLGCRLFGEAAGLAAAGLYALTPILWVYAVTPLEPTYVTAAVLLALLAAISLTDRPIWRSAVMAGGALGAGAWFRSSVILLLAPLALASAAAVGWRRAFRFVAVATASAAAIFGPWVAETSALNHTFLPAGRTGTGQTAWEELGAVSNNVGAVLSDSVTYAQVHAVRPDLVYGSVAYDRLLEQRWKATVRSDPGLLARAMLVNAWRSATLVSWLPIRAPEEVNWLERLAALGLAVGAIIGMVVRRQEWRRWIVMPAVAATAFLAQLPFVWAPRMTLSELAPFYTVMAGVTLAMAVIRMAGVPRIFRTESTDEGQPRRSHRLPRPRALVRVVPTSQTQQLPVPPAETSS